MGNEDLIIIRTNGFSIGQIWKSKENYTESSQKDKTPQSETRKSKAKKKVQQAIPQQQ